MDGQNNKICVDAYYVMTSGSYLDLDRLHTYYIMICSINLCDQSKIEIDLKIHTVTFGQ